MVHFVMVSLHFLFPLLIYIYYSDINGAPWTQIPGPSCKTQTGLSTELVKVHGYFGNSSAMRRVSSYYLHPGNACAKSPNILRKLETK